MLRHVRVLLAGLAGLMFLAVLIYPAAAFALLLVPANAKQPHDAPADVMAYVYSNGVHTDLVFPIRSPAVDWTQTFPSQHFVNIPSDASFVAIGWGDKEFYLNTPRWQDLTVGRALHALSGSGSSLLHVTYLRRADLEANVRALPLTAQQYASLVSHVNGALHRSPAGPGVNVPGQRYGATDAFYEARGTYGLFYTCNVWTGRALAQAGVKVSRWTPFASQVVWHLPPPKAEPSVAPSNP